MEQETIYIEPRFRRWICPECNRGLSHRHSFCVWCGPDTRRPDVKSEPVPQEREIYLHLVTMLKNMGTEIKNSRLRAHHFGIYGCGLKHIEEEIDICVTKLEGNL